METIRSESEINGINIHYRLYGEGEPLLLIMGLGGNADWWDPAFLEPLTERFRVITFDNRGAGRSGRPEGPYTVPLMVSDTLGLMDHLGLDSAHVMGISMGGMIAQELACTYPERVRRLILACTNCGGQEQVLASQEIYSSLFRPDRSLSREEIARAALPILFPPEFMEENPGRVERFIESYLIAPMEAKCFIAQVKGITAWSIHSRLCDLRHPTLIIAGEKDVLIPPQNSRILADAIPDSRLVKFPGGGHGIIAMFPGEIAGEVLDFLTKDQATSAREHL